MTVTKLVAKGAGAPPVASAFESGGIRSDRKAELSGASCPNSPRIAAAITFAAAAEEVSYASDKATPGLRHRTLMSSKSVMPY